MVVLSIVACIIQQSGFAELVTHFDRLREAIRQSGAFGYTLYILLFIVATLFLIPGSILVIAGGVIFDPLAGTLLSLLAATFASSLSFLFARWLGRELLLKYIGQTTIFQAIEKGIARSGADFLILTRLIPLFPYNIQNYAYGLTAIPFWTFTFISALTTLPGIFIYTLMASELIREGVTPLFVLKLTLAGLALFALIQAAKSYARYRRIATPRLRSNDEK
ncbi:TVP38/TMEM64 family protein [Klebsiella pasteurii]|uniref:TVP38/TMEM64 family protein n=1 Tax=Klebsiella pasteurii TaxID=2587529 RepID=UPI001C7D9AC0|nr:TVP38/TMEM64 family protein [Klebsiella pasteurii]MDH0313012.1 TVP38/TMEM64 family protein [Klebsiella pasteurii]MDM4217699.1 TVP38/TMEM64 family protein [Klebsiella pasteurii]